MVKTFVALWISRKPFETTPRDKLWRRMKELGILMVYRVTIHNLYEKGRDKIRTKDGTLEFFGSAIGVRQGCPLSPTFFGLYIDEFKD